MQMPLSGSHLGPHTRPLCPCNKAVFREAVCSSFMLFIATCSCINAICTEVVNDEYKYSLPKRGSPFKGSGRAAQLTLNCGFIW